MREQNIQECENYQDIIHTSWPKPSQRGRMPPESRAKIFMPFSALKGLHQAMEQQVAMLEQEQKAP